MPEQPKAESEGRKENAATSDYPDVSEVTPQAYPAARSDDSVGPTAPGDPAEGKR